MDIKELYKLVKAINEISLKNNYPTALNQLRTALTQYKALKTAVTLTPQQQQQLKILKTTIDNSQIQALNAVNEFIAKLNDYELAKPLNKVKLSSPYGIDAKVLIERIPTELDSNLDNISTEITQYYQKFSSYQQFINSINTVLGDISTEIVEQDKDELIIFFEGGATVENLKELSKVSTDWNQIVNCFGRLTKENNTDIQIISIEKGSLIATLAIATAIIGGIIKASEKILNLILKIYEVRKKALELKNMKLENIAKAIEILEKQSTINLSTEATVIVKELMHEYGWNVGDESYSETETAAIKGVKKIIKFQNSGGKVDAKILTTPDTFAEPMNNLKEKNIKFLKVEEEMRTLSAGKQILQIEEGEISDEDKSTIAI